MPEEDVSGLRGEGERLDAGLGDDGPHPVHVGVAFVGDDERRRVVEVEVLGHQVGKAVAAREVEDGTGSLVDVLERDPHPDQESGRLGHHVEGVRMSLLLAAVDEADRLEEAGGAAENDLDQLEGARILGQRPCSGRGPMDVHEPRVEVVLLDRAGGGEAVDLGVQRRDRIGIEESLGDEVAALRPLAQPGLQLRVEPREALIGLELFEAVLAIEPCRPIAAPGHLGVADRGEPGLAEAKLAVAAAGRLELTAMEELPGGDDRPQPPEAVPHRCRALTQSHRIESLSTGLGAETGASRPSARAEQFVVRELAQVLVGDLGRVRATDRAVRVALDLELGELGAERLEQEQAADQRPCRCR